MSNMLEEAIIDAEALKEAAQKSAEEKIIEHFSKDIKEAVDLILEQDPFAADPMMGGEMDPMMGAAPGLGGTMAPTTPYAPAGGGMEMAPAGPGLIDLEAEGKDTHAGEFVVQQTPFAATTSEKDVVSIDLNRLEEAIQANISAYEDDSMLEEDDDYEIDESFDLEEDDLMEEDGAAYHRNEGDDDDDPLEEDLDDDETLEEMIRNALAEEDDLMEDVDDDDDPLEEDLDDDETLEEMIRNILSEEAPIQEKVVEKTTKEREEEKAAAAKKRAAPYKKNLEKYCKDHPFPKPDRCKPKEQRWSDEDQEALDKASKTVKTVNEHKQLNNKVKLLKEKLNKYQEVFPQLKEQLEESNLQNARLHYQNRILNSDSLNERQKDRLVETISKAKTVEEAKIIYETLQSTVGASAVKSRPKSLNEIVTKSSSAFMPRKEEKRVDPLMVRMKTLAGITDK